MFNRSMKKQDQDGYQWHEEGVATLVRLVILVWSGGILTLNYITIPWLPQQKIDPTFIASIFTGTLATFGVSPAKQSKDGNGNTTGSTVAKKEDPPVVSAIDKK